MNKVIGAALTIALSLSGVMVGQAKEMTHWYEDETIAFPGYEPYYFQGKIDVLGTLAIESLYPEGKFSGNKQDYYHNPVLYGDSYRGFRGTRPMDIKGMYVTWDSATKRLLKIEIVFYQFHRDSFESLFLNTNYNPADSGDWESWDYFVNTDCYGRNSLSDGAGNTGPNRDLAVNDYKDSTGTHGGTVPAEGVYRTKDSYNSSAVNRLDRYTFAEDRALDTTNYGNLSLDSIAAMGRLRHPNGLKIAALKTINPVPDYYYYARKIDNTTGKEIKEPEDGKVYENVSIIYDFVCDQARDKSCHNDVHALPTTDLYRPLHIVLGDYFMIGFTTSSANDVMLASGMTKPEPR